MAVHVHDPGYGSDLEIWVLNNIAMYVDRETMSIVKVPGARQPRNTFTAVWTFLNDNNESFIFYDTRREFRRRWMTRDDVCREVSRLYNLCGLNGDIKEIRL